MLKKFLPRLGVSCFLLVTLPLVADEAIAYFEIPHIFGGIAAIASCVGACLPVLGMFQNSES
jgi:hypothetical protein